MKFSAAQFTPTNFNTSEDKARFANQFVKFVSGGCKERDFTNAFYRRLSNCFGHIAHYNKVGFYDTWFEGGNFSGFIEHALAYPCYGSPQFTYCDVEKALQSWLRYWLTQP